MDDQMVNGRRPTTLDPAHCPLTLNLTQTASVLGLSIATVLQLEKQDPTFPQRHLVPTTRSRKFDRDALRRWYEDNMTSSAATKEAQP